MPAPGAQGGGTTESFNENNVSQDFKKIIEQAEVVRKVLNAGSTDIDESVGNASMTDAYSGQAAASIKNQWADLAATFENFLSNFQNWYDQSVDAAKANQSLQQSTQNVQGVDAK